MQRTLEYLANRFLTGMKPTQQDFRDLMDSFFHKADLDAALQRLERISLGDGEAWQVDNALDEGSIQPVQNKVVAERLRQLAQSISTTNASLASTMGTLSGALSSLDTKASQSDLEKLAGTVATFLREIAQYRQETAETLNGMDNTIAGKVAIEQGVSQADKVLTVGADGKVRPMEPSADGNTINLGQQTDLGTAVALVAVKKRKPGRCITYYADGKWESKQFTGESIDDWSDETLWKDYGGGGSLAGLSVNGTAVTPDEEGKVNLVTVAGVKVNGTELEKDSQGKVNIAIDTVEVDETLDSESTNAIANNVVTQNLSELKEGMITSAEVEQGEDSEGNPTYSLVLGRQYGTDIVTQLPAGTGGGGGSQNLSRISLRANVSESQVKEGGRVELTYQYDHLNGDGESDGVKATITVTVRRGSTITMQRSMGEVATGTYTMDISSALQAGTMDVYVQAVCSITDEETGETKQQTKQAYKSVSVVELSLAPFFVPSMFLLCALFHYSLNQCLM